MEELRAEGRVKPRRAMLAASSMPLRAAAAGARKIYPNAAGRCNAFRAQLSHTAWLRSQ